MRRVKESHRAIQELCPGYGTCREGLTGSKPAVNVQGLLRAFDQETIKVIGIQVDHAGR